MKPNIRSNNPQGRASAFTLIEILVVLSIIALIAAFAIPAMNGVTQGSAMRQAGDDLINYMANAQQTAVTTAHPVEIRFFKFADPEQPLSEERYRAFQLVKRVHDPEDVGRFTEKAVSDIQYLPASLVISEGREYSSIFDTPLIEGSTEIGRLGNEEVEFIGFEFLPDGSTALKSINNGGHWFLTIVEEEQAGDDGISTNFVTIQVDPYNGAVRRFEP